MTWPIPESSSNGKLQKLPITTLFRWYLYDIIGEEANDHIEVFNLSSVSSEGHEKELEDSEARLINISALTPLISLYSDMNAKHSFEVQKSELLKVKGVTEEMLESSSPGLTEFYSQMTFNGIMAILSAAVELELIELNGTFTGIKETEE